MFDATSVPCNPASRFLGQREWKLPLHFPVPLKTGSRYSSDIRVAAIAIPIPGISKEDSLVRTVDINFAPPTSKCKDIVEPMEESSVLAYWDVDNKRLHKKEDLQLAIANIRKTVQPLGRLTFLGMFGAVSSTEVVLNAERGIQELQSSGQILGRKHARCTVCARKFASEADIKKHLMQVHPVKRLARFSMFVGKEKRAKYCVNFIQSLKRSLGKNDTAMLCSLCNREFKSGLSLEHHLLESHSLEFAKLANAEAQAEGTWSDQIQMFLQTLSKASGSRTFVPLQILGRPLRLLGLQESVKASSVIMTTKKAEASKQAADLLIKQRVALQLRQARKKKKQKFVMCIISDDRDFIKDFEKCKAMPNVGTAAICSATTNFGPSVDHHLKWSTVKKSNV